MRTRLLAFICLMPSLNLSPALAADTQKSYSFGVVPQQSAMVLAKNWLPILEHIQQQTGIELRFQTKRSIPEFEQQVFEQNYDFAYMNPYHYTVFHDSSNYEAFLKQSNKKLVGILVTHKDSDIHQLADLKEQALAFPAPAAFAATVIPQANLKALQIPFTSQYVSSHESVYKNIAYGNFVAGGGIERTFNNSAPEIRDQLRIFWRSEGYTPHAFAASPRVDKDDIIKIQQAFLSLNDTEQGRALLNRLKFKKIEAAMDSDWDDIRALNIRQLDKFVPQHLQNVP